MRAAAQGIVPTLVMVVNPTVQYALYEWGCNLWRRRRGLAMRRQALNSAEVFGISALAKLGATLLTYPLLVVKNRIQVRLPSSGAFCVSCSAVCTSGVVAVISRVHNLSGAARASVSVMKRVGSLWLCTALVHPCNSAG